MCDVICLSLKISITRFTRNVDLQTQPRFRIIKKEKNLFNFGSFRIDVENPISNLQSGFRPSVNKLTWDHVKVLEMKNESVTSFIRYHKDDFTTFICKQDRF